MGETRVQAATLLCKIFLHYLVLLSEAPPVEEDSPSHGGAEAEEEEEERTGSLELWWLRILDIMDRLMHSGQGDNLVCPPFPIPSHPAFLWQP